MLITGVKLGHILGTAAVSLGSPSAHITRLTGDQAHCMFCQPYKFCRNAGTLISLLYFPNYSKSICLVYLLRPS